MSDDDMLEIIYTALNMSAGANYDDLLLYLIKQAKEEAVNYCNLDEYDNKLDYTVIEMVKDNFLRRDSELLTTQAYSGVSESYISGYPKRIMRSLNHFRRVRW